MVIGGVGLFLLGMTLMTDALKALAGDALRSVLARYTSTRWTAVLAGAGVTAVVQSSSATTLATIGFVSAGLLSFQNAIGVNIGAALGTTSTGWLVSLLGLKLSIGKLMLPVIGIAVLMKLVGRGRVAQAGMAVAGFGVIFVGIDVLQEGMQGLSEWFNPEHFPRASLSGRLLLVLIGVAMTVVMQSSSAAVATTLAALAGGTIGLEQAANLVIGQNIGTTATAAIASIGASASAKRTAAAHILYNLATGLVAFFILPLFMVWVRHSPGLFSDAAVTIAAFHTGFNVLGVMLFLPMVPWAAPWIERRVKVRGPRLTQHLDPSLIQVPPVAIEAARRVLKTATVELFGSLARQLRGTARATDLALVDEVDSALNETRRFLAKVPPPDTQGFEFQRQISTMHAIDHIERLTAAARERHKLAVARQDAYMRKLCVELAGLLDRMTEQARDPQQEPQIESAHTFSQRLADERRSARPKILRDTAANRLDPEQALQQLSAQRWLDRLGYHVWRISYHLREMTHEELARGHDSALDVGLNESGL